MFNLKLVPVVISVLAVVQTTGAGDPDIVTDFIGPTNGTLDGKFFTFSGIRELFGGQQTSAPSTTFEVWRASMAEFPALNGQSVSYAVLEFAPGGVNPPHTHPRSSELLFVLLGGLQVGFVGTNSNKVFMQNLEPGDMFVFPKGLVHFQYNVAARSPAVAISAFGSANPATVSLPTTLFNTSIDDAVLALAFKTDVATIQTLKKGFA